MIPKSGYRFSEKTMLKQHAKAKWWFNLMPFPINESYWSGRAYAMQAAALPDAAAFGLGSCSRF
jgi:hypothetical protein